MALVPCGQCAVASPALPPQTPLQSLTIVCANKFWQPQSVLTELPPHTPAQSGTHGVWSCILWSCGLWLCGLWLCGLWLCASGEHSHSLLFDRTHITLQLL